MNMRRSRPGDLPRPPQSSPNQRPMQPEPPPAEPPVALDWGLLSTTPRCCVCGEAYISGPGEDMRSNSPYSLVPDRQPGNGGDESFVVLPDSAPVLSESYFSLARIAASSAGPGNSNSLAMGPVHTSHEMSFLSGASGVAGIGLSGTGAVRVDGWRIMGSSVPSTGGKGPGDDSRNGFSAELGAPGGSKMLDASGFGGWTGSGFGTGSSMLESIMHISHAGLSDNVRRESLLHELSKRPPRPTLPPPGDDLSETRAGNEGHAGDEHDGDEDQDPTLCCHCYASLLERIDEDMRLAERDALAYRDFMERLDGITELDDLPSPKTLTGREVCSQPPNASTIEWHGKAGTAPSAGPGGVERGGVVRVGLSREQNACSEDGERSEPGCVGRTKSVAADAMVDIDDVDGGDGIHNGESRTVTVATAGAGKGLGVPATRAAASHGKRAANTANGNARIKVEVSPCAHALRVARQTSLQLRKELSSLESQQEALCIRGSQTWLALAELAYSRGVLGDECRELLRDSREVAEAALELSGRSALSDLFTVRHTKGFPSINGYRLSRMPDEKQQLHWNEINAAWGQAVLLLRCVSNAIGFRSQRFRLVPLNCSSRVLELASAGNHDGGDPVADGVDSGATAPTPVVLFGHDLFSSGSGGRGDDKHRLTAAIKAFLACSTEVMAHLERRVLERRLEGRDTGAAAGGGWVGVGGGRGRNKGAGARDGIPFHQTGESVGGVLVSSVSSQKAWKSLLCQLVKNLEWAVGAGSSLCVT